MMGTPSFLTAAARRKLKSGKSIRTSAFGFSDARGLDQPVEGRERFREHADRLDESGDAEAAVVGEQLAAAGHQPLAAEPEDGGIGLPAPNFDCEGAGV